MEEQISQQVNNILVSASYQQKIREVREGVEECTSNILNVTYMSCGQAKEASYYACLTHKQDELEFIPNLALVAFSGSGKNETMLVLMHYAFDPHWISVSDETTKAALKEQLNKVGTAFIEEADKVPEGLLTRRPYKVSGPLTVFKPFQAGEENIAYLTQNYNLYGATVLHRRLEFRDNAVRRRSLILRWKHLKSQEIEELGLVFKKASALTYTKSMAAIKDIPLPDISGLSNSLKGIGNVTIDLWQGLLQLSLLFSDFDWINTYAIPAMKAENDEIEGTMDVEPGALAFRVLLSLLDENSPTPRPKDSPRKLTPIKTVDISKTLYKDYRRSMAEKQIASLLRTAGLELKNTGGYTRVYPTKESLKPAAKVFGVEDEMIDGLDSNWENWK